MYHFGSRSKRELATCDVKLQLLFRVVIKKYDCAVICGHRNEEDQNKAYLQGKSKLQYPLSEHNDFPSKAIDVIPYPINWDDLGSFYMFAGYVLRVASELGIAIRYGGDWDGDRKTADQEFVDLPHFELIT